MKNLKTSIIQVKLSKQQQRKTEIDATQILSNYFFRLLSRQNQDDFEAKTNRTEKLKNVFKTIASELKLASQTSIPLALYFALTCNLVSLSFLLIILSSLHR